MICIDAVNSVSAVSVVLKIPISPSLTGSAIILLSVSDTLRPTKAGINFSQITFSSQ